MTQRKLTRKPAATGRRPGPGRPTREQAEQRNLELLDKALDLFLEQGFERTTMESVAASVGMAKRTVYARYGDKKSLFKAALRRAINDWIVPVDVLRAAEVDDLEKSLLRIGRILVDNVITPEGQRLLRITNAESGHLPEISAYTYEQGTQPTLDYLSALFARRLRHSNRRSRESDAAAVAFMYLVISGPASLSMWGVPVDKREIAQQTRFSVRVFLKGVPKLDARPATARRAAGAGKPA